MKRLILLVALLAAFALRIYLLDAQSLWYDEGVTATIARYPIAQLVQWTAADIQPPLYYLFVAGWGRLAGWGEWSLRFPSAAAGLLLAPLMIVLTERCARRRSSWPALLAGWITVLHPWLVYYSQEARMYSLLALWAAGCGFFALDFYPNPPTGATREAAPRQRLAFVAYIIFAVAALYTHYFALFLLLALLLALAITAAGEHWLVARPVKPPHPASLYPAPLIRFLLANLIALLLYLPWLIVMLTRLTADTSYWPGDLKWQEALRNLAIRFVAGESVLEMTGRWLLLPVGVITLWALWGAWRSDRRVLRLALTWWLVPSLAVLLLGMQIPKFNPRYVMLALPGLLLVWSVGLGYWLEAPAALARPLRLAAAAALAALLAIFLFANVHWFTDPAFNKAQWRQLTDYVRRHRQANDAIILVSGHAWPIWDYYAPDMSALRLPALQILDVNAVLNYPEAAKRLRQELVGKEAAWLVSWQDDVVDPNGMAGLALDLAGRQEPLDAAFWHLGLRHYTGLQAAQIPLDSPIETPLTIRYGRERQPLLTLVGRTLLANGDLLLFWRADDKAIRTKDLSMNGALYVGNNLLYHKMVDRRPADYAYPTFRWPLQQSVIGRLRAEEWLGIGVTPNRYQLALGVAEVGGDPAGLDVLNAENLPIGKQARLTIDLPVALPAPLPGAWQGWTAIAPIADGRYVRAMLAKETSEPGERLTLTVEQAFTQPPTDQNILHLTWRSEVVSTVWPISATLYAAGAPFTPWPAPGSYRSLVSVSVPLEMPPGSAWFGLAGDDGLAADNWLRIPITILPSTRSFTAPPLAQSFDVALYPTMQQSTLQTQAALRLLGSIEPLPGSVRPSSPFSLTLVWRGEAPTADYIVSLQWLSSDAPPAAQVDASLPGESSTWLSGQVEQQTLALTTPKFSGRYRLIVALYDPAQASAPRLLTLGGADAVQLGEIVVE